MKIIFILLITFFNLSAIEIKEGDKAINFTLKTVDGKKEYSLNQFKGEVILLNLWGSWCRGCKKEMPAFYRLQKDYEGKNFRILAINIDKKVRNIKKFLRKIERKTHIKTPFIVLKDRKQTVPKQYNVYAMPTSYLIDKKGTIRLILTGSLNDEEVNELKIEIDKLL